MFSNILNSFSFVGDDSDDVLLDILQDTQSDDAYGPVRNSKRNKQQLINDYFSPYKRPPQHSAPQDRSLTKVLPKYDALMDNSLREDFTLPFAKAKQVSPPKKAASRVSYTKFTSQHPEIENTCLKTTPISEILRCKIDPHVIYESYGVVSTIVKQPTADDCTWELVLVDYFNPNSGALNIKYSDGRKLPLVKSCTLRIIGIRKQNYFLCFWMELTRLSTKDIAIIKKLMVMSMN